MSVSREELRREMAEAMAQELYGDPPAFRDDDSMYPIFVCVDAALAVPGVAAALRLAEEVQRQLQDALDRGGDGDAVRVLRSVLSEPT